MKKSKPLSLIFFDYSFISLIIISFIIQVVEIIRVDSFDMIFFPGLMAIFSLFLWYFVSKRGGKFATFLLFVFLAMKIFVIFNLMKFYWFDNVRIALNIISLILIVCSGLAIAHPSVKAWRESQKRGEAAVFD